MNCIIVEDDEFAAKVIENFIERTNGLVLIGSFHRAIEAINRLNNIELEPIDLVFLDIEMPEMTGIEFLKTMKVIPQVIINSSKEKYALESYDYEVTDYIMKPVKYGRFLKAVERVRERNEKKESPVKKSSEIFIKNNSSLVRLKYDDILWIEALENYIVVNTFKEKYTVHFTMKSIIDKIPEEKFYRVHRSFIVNLSTIKEIEDNLIVIKTESGSKLIPIGKSYKTKLMEDINLISK